MRVSQCSSDVEAELLAVLNGGVPKSDARCPTLHHIFVWSTER